MNDDYMGDIVHELLAAAMRDCERYGSAPDGDGLLMLRAAETIRELRGVRTDSESRMRAELIEQDKRIKDLEGTVAAFQRADAQRRGISIT